jgi:transposase
MYLKQSPNKSGRVYLSIVDGYYDPEKKYSRQVTLEKLGYLDALQKEYDDPVAFFSLKVEEMKKQKALKNAPIIVEFSHDETIPADVQLRKNFGYSVLSKIYHQLGIHTFLTNRQRHTEEGYDANAIMKTLVFQRLLAPASKKKTFENKDYLFEPSDFTLCDLYRCLSFFVSRKDALLLWLHEHITAHYGRDTSMVYYDVTNYHFEIDGPEGFKRMNENAKKLEPDGLRKKGVAKNHSPDPIVAMGLFIDNNGIPITYKLFPGNTNDCMTYRPNLYQIKRQFGIGRAIVVADKAMCTGDNIWYTLSAKDGYVFSMSVRGASKDYKKYVLDEDGYGLIGTDYKKKSRLEPRTIQVHTNTGRKIDKTVHEKQIVFWSEKYDRRAKAERAAVIAKAESLIAKPGSYTRATSYGAAAYVKNLKFDKKTGEVLDTGTALLLDTDKIREEEALDGYYMIVSSEHNESDERLIDMYRGLWKIEESFRVIKSDLEARPVYLSTPNHIDAHFLTCFISLTIARLLELSTGHQHSIGRMLESLAKAECTLLKQNHYLFDFCDDILKSIGGIFGIDFSARTRSLGEIKNILATTKK